MFYTYFLHFILYKKNVSLIFRPKNKRGERSIRSRSEFINALNILMKDDKPYKKSNLKSVEIANRLGMPLHDFSSLINEQLGKKFSDFINEYRVEEAKQLISENPNYTLEAIGNMSGFNSKSAFYRAFRKFTKMTPAQFKA